ncbi:Uncharacterised protein [Moellerella wisconsensis]|nr:Uncharacterised protein [Moellerella wisconsensis]
MGVLFSIGFVGILSVMALIETLSNRGNTEK